MPPTVDAGRKTVGDFVEAYEAARLRDGYADIPAFLPHPDDPLYLPVLRELVRVELEYDWERAQPRQLEDYRISFPQLFADRESLQLITFEEYRLRFQAGEGPSPAEYEQRFGVDARFWPPLSGARPSAPRPAGVRRDDAPGLRITHRVAAERTPDFTGGSGASPRKGEPETLDAGPADVDCADRLAELYASVPGAAERVRRAADRMPRAGESFLGFRLHGELGRGAFGRVFLAQQNDLANRWVALKVAPDLGGESQTLAQLQHTHIVPIYSVHEDGPLQAVCMPYFGATTLAHVLHDVRNSAALPSSGKSLLHTLDARKSATRHAGGPDVCRALAPRVPADSRSESATFDPPPGPAAPRPTMLEGLSYSEAVLWMAARLADGLAHAHERGILHRDLKPAHVLLTDDGQPMLLDFNLAQDTKLSGAAVAHVGGTLPYMAPEHLEAFCNGKRPVDGRSDVFAFGVILYELLTGRHPFPLRRGPLETILPEMIADRAQPSPALRPWNRAVSPAVEAVVRRCLEPEPEQRYTSARQLHEDLQRQLEHLPLKHTREPSLRERAAKWRRRHPRLAVLTVALLLLAGLTATFLALYHRQAQREERLETLGARDTLHQLREQVRRVRFGLMLPDADERQREEAETVARQVFHRYGVLESSDWLERPAARALPQEDRTWLREQTGELLLHAARLALLEARTTTDSARKQEKLDEARRLHRAAATCYAEEDTPRALWRQRADLARQAGHDAEAQSCEERAASQPLRAFTDHYLLVAEHLAHGRYSEAMPYLDELRRRQPTEYAVCLTLAAYHTRLRQYEDAELWYQQAILQEPDNPEAYFLRGALHQRREQYKLACADFDRALKRQPEHGSARYSRAATRFALNDLDGALEDLDELLKGEAPPLRAYFLRAFVHDRRGDAAAARKDRAEAMRRLPTNSRDWAARGAARSVGDPKAALADLDQALALNAGHADTWQSRAHVLAERLGRTEEAIEALTKALQLQPDSAPALAGRGVLYARLGRRDAALADAKAALVRDGQPLTLYQAGCIYALTSRQNADDRGEALRLLSVALRQGFGFDLLDKDRDLDPIRELPEFQRRVKAAREIHGSK